MIAALTLLHLFCFVYWLGSDLGTFYSAGLVVRRDLSPEARVTAARIMAATDLAARVALVVGLLFVALLASPRPRLRSIGAVRPWVMGIWAWLLLAALTGLHGIAF